MRSAWKPIDLNTTAAAHSTLDQAAIRARFPILSRQINGRDLVYLDNAASTQKPQSVIDRITRYYSTEYSNIHRGVHTLSQIGTDAYEAVRRQVRGFINAHSESEVIFTKGTTDGINLVASCFGRRFIQPGDEIVITGMEHHSNIVPWQMMCEQRGAVLRVIPLRNDGTISLEDAERLIGARTKMVSVVWVSNSLGTVNPVRELISLARGHGASVLIDAAQAVQHFRVDVQDLGADFVVFSGHKIYGPTGTGILWGREALLNDLPPYQGGGDMIKDVRFSGTTYNDLPFKFEAGTPNIAGCIGLGAALDFLEETGLDNIAAHEAHLLACATERLSGIEGIRLIGEAPEKNSVLSFLVGNHHPYDVGVLLDQLGIAIRTGHHCTQPVMDHFGIPGTCRASFAVYNTEAEIDRLAAGVERAVRMLG